MSSCGLNASMETSAPLVNAIVNNTLFHSNSHINQTRPHLFTSCVFVCRLVARDFVIKTIMRSRLFNTADDAHNVKVNASDVV